MIGDHKNPKDNGCSVEQVADQYKQMIDFLINKHQDHGFTYDDAYNHALEGVMKAMNEYDPSREKMCAFSTFLYMQVRASLQKGKREITGNRYCSPDKFIVLMPYINGPAVYVYDDPLSDIAYALKSKLPELIKELSACQQKVIQLLMNGVKQNDMACTMNISKQRISVLVKESLSFLKDHIEYKKVLMCYGS